MKKFKDNHKPIKIVDNNIVALQIVEFPKAICLEHCQIDVVRGYEKDVITTLKSFSDKEKFNFKKPHFLTKSGDLNHFFDLSKSIANGRVWSLDVKARHDKYRLLYCIDNNKVHKILALCTDDTHDE